MSHTNELDDVLAWPCNAGILQEVVMEHYQKRLALYLGAGVSCDYGLPTWPDFLRRLCPREMKDLRDELERRIESGDLEGAASSIHGALREDYFQRAVEELFRSTVFPQSQVRTTLRSVAELYRGLILTTNFDTLLEQELRELRELGVEKVVDPPRLKDISPQLSDEDTLVVRLHGQYNLPSQRVLTDKEYAEAYGTSPEDAPEDAPKPLRRFLRHAFLLKSFLFIGCGLTPDRPLKVLAGCAALDPLSKHFAVLPVPGGYDHSDLCPPNYPPEYRHLARSNVRVLWIPPGRFDLLPALVERALARSETNVRVLDRPATVVVLQHPKIAASTPRLRLASPFLQALSKEMLPHGFHGPLLLRQESSSSPDPSTVAFWLPLPLPPLVGNLLDALLIPFDEAQSDAALLDCSAAAAQIDRLQLNGSYLEGAPLDVLRVLLQRRNLAAIRTKPAIAVSCESSTSLASLRSSRRRLLTAERLKLAHPALGAGRTPVPIGFQLKPATAQPFTYLAYVLNPHLKARTIPSLLNLRVSLDLQRAPSAAPSPSDLETLSAAIDIIGSPDDWRQPILELLRDSKSWIHVDPSAGSLQLHGLWCEDSGGASIAVNRRLSLDASALYRVRFPQSRRLARVRTLPDAPKVGKSLNGWSVVLRPYHEPSPIPFFDVAARIQDEIVGDLVDSLELEQSPLPATSEA